MKFPLRGVKATRFGTFFPNIRQTFVGSIDQGGPNSHQILTTIVP